MTETVKTLVTMRHYTRRLSGKVWVNEDEIPNNGVDDDKNGYVDDVNGWNFLGDSSNEQLEYVRLLASGDKANPRYGEAKALHEKEVEKYTTSKNRYETIVNRFKEAKSARNLKKIISQAFQVHL